MVEQDDPGKKERMGQAVKIRGIEARDLNDILRWRDKQENLEDLENYYRNKKIRS